MLYTRAQKRQMQLEEIHELLKHSTMGDRAWVIRFLRGRQENREKSRQEDREFYAPNPLLDVDDED